MEYCTLSDLKWYLWVSGSTEDQPLQELITTLTSLVDIELWWNLWLQTIGRRISWMWTNRIIMEWKINTITNNSVKLYYSYASNEYTNISVMFIEWSIVHLERIVPKWNKNVFIEYTRWFETLPVDMKTFFLKYCKEMRNIQKNWENLLESKKVEGLAISYFSPSEIIEAKKENSLGDFASILKKYKNFNSIAY